VNMEAYIPRRMLDEIDRKRRHISRGEYLEQLIMSAWEADR